MPHDAVNHFHDDFIDDAKEVDDRLSLFSKRSKDSAKGQTKEDDAQSVSSRAIPQFSNVIQISRGIHFDIGWNVFCMSLIRKINNKSVKDRNVFKSNLQFETKPEIYCPGKDCVQDRENYQQYRLFGLQLFHFPVHP